MAYVMTPIPAAANTARVLLTTGAIWGVLVGDGAKDEDAASARALYGTRDVNFGLHKSALVGTFALRSFEMWSQYRRIRFRPKLQNTSDTSTAPLIISVWRINVAMRMGGRLVQAPWTLAA